MVQSARVLAHFQDKFIYQWKTIISQLLNVYGREVSKKSCKKFRSDKPRRQKCHVMSCYVTLQCLLPQQNF